MAVFFFRVYVLLLLLFFFLQLCPDVRVKHARYYIHDGQTICQAT